MGNGCPFCTSAPWVGNVIWKSAWRNVRGAHYGIKGRVERKVIRTTMGCKGKQGEGEEDGKAGGESQGDHNDKKKREGERERRV